MQEELKILSQILFEQHTENFEIFKENDAIKRDVDFHCMDLIEV
jgi:hypothetical protein